MVLADNWPFTVNASLAEAQLYHRNVGPLILLHMVKGDRREPVQSSMGLPTLETVLEMYRPSVI